MEGLLYPAFKKKTGILRKEGCLFSAQEKLLLADSEHLGAASRADALGSWLAILHSDGFGVLHFLLGAAFNTISLHSVLPPFVPICPNHKSFRHACQ